MHTLATLGSIAVQDAIQKCMSTTFQLDYVKHALLALSAAHMLPLSDCTSYQLSELYHSDQALLFFGQRITCSIDSSEYDAVILCGKLLNTKEISLNEYTLSKLWLLLRQSDPHWLTIHARQECLMLQCGGLLKQSSWAPIWETEAGAFHQSHPHPFRDERAGSDGIPLDFLQLFGINGNFNPQNNVYHPLLIPMLCADTSESIFTPLLTFIHRIRPEFYRLLKIEAQRSTNAADLGMFAWTDVRCSALVGF